MARSNRDGAYEEREAYLSRLAADFADESEFDERAAYRVRVAAGVEFDDFDDDFDDLQLIEADDLIYDHDDYMAEEFFLI